MRSGRGHIVQRIAQTNELRSARARFCHVGSTVSNAPAAVRRARGAGISPNASPFNHRTASRPRAILPCRLNHFEHSRSRRCARGAGISSNASPKPTNCDQPARGFAMSAQPFRMRPQPSDALGARAYRPTHHLKPTNCDQPARDIAISAHLGAASLVRRFAALATPSTAVNAPSAAANALASRRRLSALSGSAVRASITSAESAAWTSFQ